MAKRKLRTNKQLLAAIQALESTPILHINSDRFCYAMNNGVFEIHVTGGEKDESIPEKKLDKLEDYEKLSIEVWDHRDMPECNGLPDINIPANAYGKHEAIHFSFQIHTFPHQPTIVRYDDRFKTQKWAKEFKGSKALVAPATLCTILRYLDKISHMKAFW